MGYVCVRSFIFYYTVINFSYNGKQGYAPASYLEKAHEWVQENNRRPLHPILTDSKQRHSLPANSLSTIASPGPHILHSGGLSVTNNSVDTTNGFAVKPTGTSHHKRKIFFRVII